MWISGEWFPLFIGTGIKSGCVLSDRHYWGTVKDSFYLFPSFHTAQMALWSCTSVKGKKPPHCKAATSRNPVAFWHWGWDRLETLIPLTASGILMKRKIMPFLLFPGPAVTSLNNVISHWYPSQLSWSPRESKENPNFQHWLWISAVIWVCLVTCVFVAFKCLLRPRSFKCKLVIYYKLCILMIFFFFHLKF